MATKSSSENRIFDQHIREAFALAQSLHNANMEEEAVTLVKEAVEHQSFCGTYNLLRLFYGREVFGGIRTLEDGVRYTYVVACLKEFFENVGYLGAASSPTGWVRADKKNTKGVQALTTFFRWLDRRNRIPDTEVQTYLQDAKKAILDGVDYPMANRIKKLEFCKIIEGIVNGSINLDSGGKLV